MIKKQIHWLDKKEESKFATDDFTGLGGVLSADSVHKRFDDRVHELANKDFRFTNDGHEDTSPFGLRELNEDRNAINRLFSIKAELGGKISWAVPLEVRNDMAY